MKTVVHFKVFCLKPVPWSAPQVYMKERKGGGSRYKSAARNPECEAWQAYVKLHAEEAMQLAEATITLKPVLASVTFFRRTEDPELLGKWWFNGVAWKAGKDGKPGEYVKTGETVPDADNLAKATLDALQGVVFGNDVQVCVLMASRFYASYDGCEVIISELEPGDETL
jgi:Holliday junction resolvase RusA-like endonuclease